MLVSGPAGPSDRKGIWFVTTLAGVIHKLRDDACGAAFSPDGLQIAFLNGKRTELWLMDVHGKDARKLADAGPYYRFTEVAWSPDTLRIACLRRHRADREYLIEALTTNGKQSVILSDPQLRSFCWTPDGRIVYSRMEGPPGERNFSLWEIQTSARTGAASGRPRQIASGAHAFWYLSAAMGARRLAFLKNEVQSDIWVAKLEGKGLNDMRRVTTDDRADWPSGWTRDSRALLFYSNRNGTFDLFKQGLDKQNAELLLASPEEERWPQISPDGAWILYLAWTKTPPEASAASGKLMRVPVWGGAATPVLDVRGYPGLAQVESEPRARPVAQGYPSFRCPSVQSSYCVLAEEEGNRLVFSAFDPVAGRKGEVARLELSSNESFWDLSPDGTIIAVGEKEERQGLIRILPIRGASREIPVRGWNYLDSAAWSADGKALFVTSYSSRGSSLLRVGLDGEARMLYQSSMWLLTIVPSPDGSHLALGKAAESSNAWMVENF